MTKTDKNIVYSAQMNTRTGRLCQNLHVNYMPVCVCVCVCVCVQNI